MAMHPEVEVEGEGGTVEVPSVCCSIREGLVTLKNKKTGRYLYESGARAKFKSRGIESLYVATSVAAMRFRSKDKAFWHVVRGEGGKTFTVVSEYREGCLYESKTYISSDSMTYRGIASSHALTNTLAKRWDNGKWKLKAVESAATVLCVTLKSLFRKGYLFDSELETGNVWDSGDKAHYAMCHPMAKEWQKDAAVWVLDYHYAEGEGEGIVVPATAERKKPCTLMGHYS